MNEFTRLLTGANQLIDPSRIAGLVGVAYDLLEKEDLQARAINRALNQLHPLPASTEGLDPEALVLAVADIQDIKRCAIALSCLPRAGKVESTIDGRFTRAVRGVLNTDDRRAVDDFVGDPNLPESSLQGGQWHSEQILLYGGLQGLLMGLEFGDAIAARFSLRFPSQVFDAAPSVMLKQTPIVRQLCRKILRLDPLS